MAGPESSWCVRTGGPRRRLRLHPATRRAKKYEVSISLTLEQVRQIIEEHADNCPLCDANVEILSHAFPLSQGAPCVMANVIPTCKECWTQLENGRKDLVILFNEGVVDQDKYIDVMRAMFRREGADLLKPYVRKLIGLE